MVAIAVAAWELGNNEGIYPTWVCWGMGPVVEGGSMAFPTRPGVDTAWLAEREAGAESPASSFFVGTMLGGAGDATVSGKIFALAGLSAAGVGVPVRKRLLLRPVPFAETSLLTGLLAASGAGESWGAFLTFNFIFGPVDWGAEGPVESGTTCFASFKAFLTKVCKH